MPFDAGGIVVTTYWLINHHDHSDFRSLQLFLTVPAVPWSFRSLNLNENFKGESPMNRSLRIAICPRNRLFNYAHLCFTGRKRNYIVEKMTQNSKTDNPRSPRSQTNVQCFPGSRFTLFFIVQVISNKRKNNYCRFLGIVKADPDPQFSGTGPAEPDPYTQ